MSICSRTPSLKLLGFLWFMLPVRGELSSVTPQSIELQIIFYHSDKAKTNHKEVAFLWQLKGFPTFAIVPQVFGTVINFYKVGPSLVINEVITPISKIISTHIPIYFRPFIGAPFHPPYNDRLGAHAHLVPHIFFEFKALDLLSSMPLHRCDGNSVVCFGATVSLAKKKRTAHLIGEPPEIPERWLLLSLYIYKSL